jgi:hypothetical protein
MSVAVAKSRAGKHVHQVRDDLESLCNVLFYCVLRYRPTTWDNPSKLNEIMVDVFNPEPSRSPFRKAYVRGDFLAPEEIIDYLQPAVLAKFMNAYRSLFTPLYDQPPHEACNLTAELHISKNLAEIPQSAREWWEDAKAASDALRTGSVALSLFEEYLTCIKHGEWPVDDASTASIPSPALESPRQPSQMKLASTAAGRSIKRKAESSHDEPGVGDAPSPKVSKTASTQTAGLRVRNGSNDGASR